MLTLRSLKSFLLFSLAGFMMLSFFESAHAASLTFTPSSSAFKQGCSAKIDLVVDTQGVSTNAVDAVILFNPAEVQIEDQNSVLPGIQIKSGNVYEIYAGNLVNESQGKILLTAFSVVGTFNGSGLLGSIYFTSKPGVTNTTFQIEYTPGLSTDSNVADTNGNDVLSSVNSGSYSFQASPCVEDTQAPSVSQLNPANGTTGVPLNTNISLHISDNQSGVDLDSVEIQVHDVIYTLSSPEMTVTGLPLDYAFSINPASDFPEETEIVMLVRAADLNGNLMSPKIYSFNKPVIAAPAVATIAVCGNGILEAGEACEPPNTFFCDANCQADVLQCLTVDPELLETLALEAIEDGVLTPEQIASISSLQQLSEALGDATYVQRTFLVGGTATREVVKYVTQSAETVVKSLGCTDDCVKVIFGENSQRWYVPVMILLILFIILLYLVYKIAQKLSERSERATEMQEKGRKKK